jgi:flagellar basal body-associated protein FliL
LVVNPRGSSSRYVLVALGLEVENAKYAEKVRQELMIPVRDRIMSVVSSYSIEELQANGARDSLRVRLRQELSSVLPGILGGCGMCTSPSSSSSDRWQRC